MHSAAAIVRKPMLAALALAAGALAIVLLLLYGPSPNGAKASSHAEAPLIGQDPRADNTDLYAFVSPENTNMVTIVANYIPLEAPASGPNFYSFDDSVLYAIKVDNDGDAEEDLTYQFRFNTATKNPNTFLYNTGPITSLNDADWNRPQTYSVTLVRHGEGASAKKEVLGTNIPTPPANIGPRSTPSYGSLAAAAVTTLPGGAKVFAGPRDDPFYVDLGSIFDLAGLRPFNGFHALPLGAEAGVDAVQNYNTHAIEIQVPIAQLVDIPKTTIGIYASASRQKERVFRTDGTADSHGPYVQVSRLGNPLVNEVIIPLGQKDFWNREDPGEDAQFERFYAQPEVAALENLLYGGVLQPIAESGRSDLDAILLTGVPGLNFTGATQADLLRLNTALKPGANGACFGGTASAAAPSRLAVLDGDLCGYPNGRRLVDDVVDIDLRAIAQGYGSVLNGLLGLPNLSPNNLVGDGVDANDVSLSGTFPYLATPHQGYEVP